MSWTYILIFLMGMCLSGCSTTMGNYAEYSQKPFTQITATGDLLRGVPDLDQDKITIAIYDFLRIVNHIFTQMYSHSGQALRLIKRI